MTSNRWIVCLALIALMASLAPEEAAATELVIGGNLRVGAAFISDDDGDTVGGIPTLGEVDAGLAGVGQVFFLIKFASIVSVGVTLDGVASTHDTQNSNFGLDANAGTFAGMLRVDPLPFLGLSFWAGYTFGELSPSVSSFGFTVSGDGIKGSGLGLGGSAMFRIGGSEALSFEAGPVFTLGYYAADENNGSNDTVYTSISAALQVVYEIGL